MKNTNNPETTEKLGLDAADWRFRFKFEGKRYTLFKVIPGRDSPWQIDIWVRGTRIKRSLDSNIGDAAAAKAINDFIRPAKRGESVAENKLRRDYATIGEVLAEFKGFATGELKAGVPRCYETAMWRVVRRGLGNDGMTEAAFRAVSTGDLNGRLVSQFEDYMKRACVAAGGNMNSTKRSIAGFLANARAVFKKRYLSRYAEAGLKLPSLTEFLERETAPADKLVKLPASDELLARTFTSAKDLKKTNRAAYMAFMLAACSLRRAEIGNMRWDWAQRIDGRPYIVVPKEFAKSGAARAVPVDERVLTELEDFRKSRQVGLDVAAEEYVLPGGGRKGLRGDTVFRQINAWMRVLGWKTSHTLHEMRAYYLRSLDAEHGLQAAQTAAGHSSSKTTEAHYIGVRALKAVTVSLPKEMMD